MRRTRSALAALLVAAAVVPGASALADRAAGLGPGDVAAGMSARKAAFGDCYERMRAKKPDLVVRFTVTVTLEPSGKVKRAAVKDHPAPSPEVEACVLGVIGTALFREPYMEFTFSYPFHFTPPGPAAAGKAALSEPAPVPLEEPPPPPPPPPVTAAPGSSGKKIVKYGDDGRPIGSKPDPVPSTSAPIGDPYAKPPSSGKPSGFGAKPKPVPAPGVLASHGKLDKEIIKRVVAKHKSSIQYCYESELLRSPTLAGKVAVKFVIGTSGEVTSAELASSTIRSLVVEECVVARVKKMVFPKPEGGIVIVTYPWVFRTDGDSTAPGDPAVEAPPAGILGAMKRGCGEGPGGAPRVTMRADGADVEWSACAKLDAFRSCYVIELAADARTEGRTELAFTVGAGGKVTKTRVMSSTHGRPALDACYLRVLRSVKFGSVPAPSDRTLTLDATPYATAK